MISALSASFAALTLALCALWAARLSPSPRAARLWTYPFAFSAAAALAAGILDVRGVLVLLAFAVACRAANRAVAPRLRLVAHVLMLLIAAGLFLHVLPGFRNPLVFDGVVLAAGGVPYTQYWNFDKGTAGLFLLGIYAPELLQGDEGARHAGSVAWRAAVLLAVVMALSLALGYVRPDPRLPAWFPQWAWSIAFLTALPEEALFRGVVQTGLARRIGERGAIAAAALLFGLAHLAGGPIYVVLATVAGAGYGWIYASTRSIALAILAHTLVNVVHFLAFTYPALAQPRPLVW